MMANIVDLGAWKGTLQKNGKGGPKKNVTNLLIHIQNMRGLGGAIRWNELAQRAEWNGQPIEDSDLIEMRLMMEAQDFEPPVNDLLQTVVKHAKTNSFHPVREYLKGLRWDGVKRLDFWLHQCLGAPQTPFNKLVGRKTLIAAVARAMRPGCKVDTVLVLEGPQGIKKSTAIAALFNEEWTAESVNLFDQHNKMVMSMMGAWVVELAEFVAIAKRDQNTVKGILSMRNDRVVLPYAKIASDHPRQCVFFGTINPGDMGYLTDKTGNRRYWPVEVAKADIGLIEDRRDQLWAEAFRAYLDGERWWLEEEEYALAGDIVSDREEYDVWEEILANRIGHKSAELNRPVDALSVADALQLLGLPNERMGRAEQLRAANVLRRLGFVADNKPSKVTDDDGKRRSVKLFRRKTDE